MLKFSHVALSCADPLVTERWYTRHFGFSRARVIPIPDSPDLVFLKRGEVYLELFEAEGPRPTPALTGDGLHSVGLRHLAFQVSDVDALLAALGDDTTVTLGPLAFDDVIPGWKTAWCTDPDGNIVEVSQGYVDQPDPPALAD